MTLLAAMAIVDHLERSEARGDALSLAEAVAREIRPERALTREALEEEVREFTHGGRSIAILGAGGEHLAGPAELPRPSHAGGCEVQPVREVEWFVCAAEAGHGRVVLVGEPMDALLSHRRPLLAGGAIALVVVLLASVLAGIVVGRWSLAPLVRFEGEVARIEAAHPEKHRPFGDSGLREVDGIARALDDLIGRLGEELARSRRFSADAAHELRTPLSKLRAELELAAEDTPAESDTHAVLLRAVARTDELTNLVNRLLLLASPEEALQARTLTSLAVVLELVLDDLECGAERVELDIESDGLVRGSQEVLRSVMSNAIDNALKYSDGEVRVRVTEEEDIVLVRVDDDGPGLGAEGRTRAFEAFYRGPDKQAAPGHGVGLALIAHVARAHGGTARFLDDEPGAKLEIRLPRHDHSA